VFIDVQMIAAMLALALLKILANFLLLSLAYECVVHDVEQVCMAQ
jgi:hypothetical protein